MANPSITESTAEGLNLPVVADDLERGVEALWYAVYTCANHERRVADQLADREVEHFLPQYDSVRQWKDRKVRLRLPLFPGYVFVQLALRDRLRVLEVPGVVRFVGFDGRPVSVAADEITRIREFLDRGLRAEPHRYLTAGKKVTVNSGPLAGMQGILLRRKGKLRVVISVKAVQQSLAVEVDAMDLEPLGAARS